MILATKGIQRAERISVYFIPERNQCHAWFSRTFSTQGLLHEIPKHNSCHPAVVSGIVRCHVDLVAETEKIGSGRFFTLQSKGILRVRKGPVQFSEIHFVAETKFKCHVLRINKSGPEVSCLQLEFRKSSRQIANERLVHEAKIEELVVS